MIALAYAACVRGGSLPARPSIVLSLALLPAVALGLAVAARARGLALAAFLELVLAFGLSVWLQLVHVWRLD